jgi:hypothetical protein
MSELAIKRNRNPLSLQPASQVDPSLAVNRIVVGETLVTQRYVLCEQVDP